MTDIDKGAIVQEETTMQNGRLDHEVSYGDRWTRRFLQGHVHDPRCDILEAVQRVVDERARFERQRADEREPSRIKKAMLDLERMIDAAMSHRKFGRAVLLNQKSLVPEAMACVNLELVNGGFSGEYLFDERDEFDEDDVVKIVGQKAQALFSDLNIRVAGPMMKWLLIAEPAIRTFADGVPIPDAEARDAIVKAISRLTSRAMTLGAATAMRDDVGAAQENLFQEMVVLGVMIGATLKV
jgi:hypothetical protein